MKLIDSSIVDIKGIDDLTVVSPVNIYGVEFGANVFVGPFVEIQRNTKVGDNTKIQSHSFVCEFVTIGRDCFIGHGVMFVNDKFSDGGPAQGDRSKWISTEIGDRVSIGSNATILPVTICDDVVIGAGAVVTKSIVEPGKYVGNPARKL